MDADRRIVAVDWTQYDAVNKIIDTLLSGHKQIFGDKMSGFYLYGSLVWGDFDIHTSDIDTLVVTTSEITLEELEKLRAMHQKIVCENPLWRNRLEVHYAPLEGLKNFRTSSFQMGNISPGEPLHMINSGMDWIDEWYCVQEYAVTLYGMDIKKVMPPIEKYEFIQAVCGYAQSFRERIRTCRESCYSQAYAVLTLCRALYTLKTGEQVSKPAAARWAMDFMPKYNDVISSALLWRQERDAASRNPHETYILAERFVDDVLDTYFSHENSSVSRAKPMLVLTGPTAVGKTRLSIALAKAVDGEILSADSMQVYRHMDIGSAKITREEMQGVPHHLIDILNPEEPFNVVVFKEKCEEALKGIYERGHIPILIGGTGFYIQAVLKDIDFTENQENTEYRSRLEALAQEKGAEYLHEQLRKVDEKSAAAIHANNIKRVIRALEYYHLTGEKISSHNEQEKQKTSAYNSCYFVLNDKRERLYEQIELRVDKMLEDGLVEEVKKLQQMGCHREMVSMQGLGYKEILKYLEGEITLEQAVYLIKRDTRHFAKRQLTWFKREPDVIWVNKYDFDYEEERMLEYMLSCLREKGILK